MEALKTHVSLREALELEAVKCEAGDRRHDFQAFYPTWKEQERNKGADLSKLGQLDAARVLEEIEMTRQAIDEHEAMLAEHRLAITEGRPSGLRDSDVDAIYGIIESMRTNLPSMEAQLAELVGKHHDGGSLVSAAQLDDLTSVGPVQSGTLRPFKGGR